MVFTLRHYEQYKLKEIAEMMNCAEGTVKKYLFEATQKLRTHLHDLYEQPMKKQEYKELMILSVYGELESEEQKKLDLYLQKNPNLKEEFLELKKMNAVLNDNTPPHFSEQLLSDARKELRSHIRASRNAKAWWKGIFSVNVFRIPQFQLAAVALIMFALGGTTTQFICSPNQSQSQKLSLQNVSNDLPEVNRTKISNVQFLDSDASDGEIEFRCEATAPMYVKGKINDPEIQKILTYALLNESNAGTRISTVNALAEHAGSGKIQDSQMKSVLIRSLKTDENPGVRREAMRVLLQFTFDDEIRDVLFFILTNDKNTGMRVAAINALEMAKMDGNRLDTPMLKQLQHSLKKENNSYVRTKAENLIGEIYQ